MQSKILEAMAMKTPVIATSNAVTPLHARAGQDLVTADSADEFANRIVELISAPERQRMFAENGRAFVETHLSWRASVRKLLDVYALAQNRRMRE
jgi:glycosyltransferase involved in cell wall biosynthesis